MSSPADDHGQPTAPPGPDAGRFPVPAEPQDRRNARVDRWAGPATDVVAGRYALCDPLESGGSGTVWRAYDLQRRQYCAAKLLRRREAGQLLRFVREQEVRLTGRHLASPYAWAAEESDVLIATELIDGGSLHRLTAEYGALAEATVAAVLDQVLDGLDAVHRAGLVHRDVKPGNLLLRATRGGPLHVLLIDFGLAIGAADARLTELGMVIGTPGYLPPELARADAGPAPAQDLFAAGRVAAALLTAHEPKLGVPLEVPITDPVLRAVVAALVDFDPQRRPADAATARRMLAGARMDPHPLTAGGQRIDLVPRVPPLPAGWDPVHGPTAAAHPVDPRAAAPSNQPSTRLEPSGPPHSAGPSAGSGVGPTPQSPGVLRAGRPSRWPALVGAVGGAMAIGGLVLALLLHQGPTTSDGPLGTTVPASPPAGLPGTVAVGPRPGQECDWSDEGRTSSGPEGAVSCRVRDGGYRWIAAG
ncbi:protein kinase [Nakamurella sp. A5-74]|uniref:non-specific serine/threonine protein kinase n=1 Tax=Nakamurella sp. A5-74 TaxID=3158264 RepID=A0AAU8DQ13_9ACTN